MLQKEVIEAGEKIASDLFDAQVSKNMGNMGDNIIKDASEYENSDLIQMYLDKKICSVEAIYIAMKRVEENSSLHNKKSTPCQHKNLVNDNPVKSAKCCISCGEQV